MKRLEAGTVLDGFLIGPCLHAGGMAHIYAVTYADARPAPFPMVMKVPRMTSGDGAENIIGFEVEHQILQILQGRHVPRFVAAGDLEVLPYLVMEHVQGNTLQHILDQHAENKTTASFNEIAKLGASIARAVHSLHQQNACHLDLKPANILLHPDGYAVLLDFGLSCHAHQPDLLAEELRKAIGSPTWIAPEQVVGVRGDPRSDIFAIGVMLYEFVTSELPFGNPVTQGGMRQRLWMDPTPPRKLKPDIPDWLQEIILRCLHPQAALRYPSAAHLAFDLEHSDQVRITQRGQQTAGTSVWTHLKRWLKAAGMHYHPSPLPAQQITEVPIVMVALPHYDVRDDTLYSLKQAVARSLGVRPGARLAVVTVISPHQSSASEDLRSETTLHRRYLTMQRQWVEGLDLQHHQCSFHVLESGDVAEALLRYAQGNHVDMIVMGAATHGLTIQRVIAPVPIKVAMEASCSVLLVKQALPFSKL
jgi:serine/threonine protein kinase